MQGHMDASIWTYPQIEGMLVKTRLRIRELAMSKKVSLNKLSRAADVDSTTMQRLVHNPESQGVTLYTLAKLATALGVHVADLFEEIED